MTKLVIAGAVGLLWAFILAFTVGWPVLLHIAPDPAVWLPNSAPGMVKLIGFGALALWLIGTDIYIRNSAGRTS